MIPNNTWSSDTTLQPFATYGKAVPAFSAAPLRMMSLGPKGALSQPWNKDTSDWWQFAYENGEVVIYRFVDNAWQKDSTLFTLPACKRLSGTFDQNGRPLVFFDTGTELRLWWYDPIAGANTTTVFGVGAYPFATFDIKYGVDTAYSDVLLFYVRDNAIYYRLQRDRYGVEYPTPVTADAMFIKAADMAVDYRMQLVYRARDRGFAPPPVVPPVVVPPPGRWGWRLTGYRSFIDSRAIRLPLDGAFCVALTLDSVELNRQVICLWSQQIVDGEGDNGGMLALSFTGARHNVLRLLYGGRLFESVMPFSLAPGHWETEVTTAGGLALTVRFTPPGGATVQQHRMPIGSHYPISETHVRLKIGALNSYGAIPTNCLRAVVRNIRVMSPLLPAPMLQIALDKATGQRPAITLADGAPSGLEPASIAEYQESCWVYVTQP